MNKPYFKDADEAFEHSQTLVPCSSGAKPSTYERQHSNLVAYLLDGVERQDWHLVSDAANDLRVLEAKEDKCSPLT